VEITDVRAILLSCPMPSGGDPPWRTCSDYGTVLQRNAVIVEVETDEDITGYGEALGDTRTLKTLIEKNLKPRLLGKDPTRVEGVWEMLFQGSRLGIGLRRGMTLPTPGGRSGVYMSAISGIDIALWDIAGKVLKQPVYKLLGGGGIRDRIRVYASAGGWELSPKALGKVAERYVEDGFTAIKIRWGMGAKADVARMKAVRDAVGDEVALMVDCHGAQSLHYILKMADTLETYDIFWIEEPLMYDDVEGYAELKSRITTRIAAGESWYTRFGFKPFIERRAVDILQPEPGSTGGLTEARRIATLGSAWGLPCVPHAWGTGIILAAGLHLTTSISNGFLLEYKSAPDPLFHDIFTDPIKPRKGYIDVPKKPGLGIHFDKETALKKFPYKHGPTRKAVYPKWLVEMHPEWS
jgi:D-galactarolactone cycloisomerase